MCSWRSGGTWRSGGSWRSGGQGCSDFFLPALLYLLRQQDYTVLQQTRIMRTRCPKTKIELKYYTNNRTPMQRNVTIPMAHANSINIFLIHSYSVTLLNIVLNPTAITNITTGHLQANLPISYCRQRVDKCALESPRDKS